MRFDATEPVVYTTNMATPAANIAAMVIATTPHPKRELGCPCISFLSEATTRIATSRKGANNPLMIDVQYLGGHFKTGHAWTSQNRPWRLT